ncbi:MAG: hypothetical protein WD250_17430 [Egibacteraceae bacterium]
MNHPREETRVSCTTCEAPICPRCMHQSAVGHKCPACARPPRGSRLRGKPIHYVKAVGAGLPVAAAGGLVILQLVAVVRFGIVIFSALLGAGVGMVVRWGANGQTQPPFPAVAVGCAVGGLLLAFWIGLGTPIPLGPQGLWFALGLAAAGYFAVRGLHR